MHPLGCRCSGLGLMFFSIQAMNTAGLCHSGQAVMPRPSYSCLIDALVQTSIVTMAVLSKIGAEHDLSLTQLRVLGILRAGASR